VSNLCELELPGSTIGMGQIVQTGTVLTLTTDRITATGSINPTTGDFTLSGTFSSGGLTITPIQSGRFTSSTRFTAETVYTISDGVESCVFRTSDSGVRL
jgi:hypothetical protein